MTSKGWKTPVFVYRTLQSSLKLYSVMQKKDQARPSKLVELDAWQTLMFYCGKNEFTWFHQKYDHAFSKSSTIIFYGYAADYFHCDCLFFKPGFRTQKFNHLFQESKCFYVIVHSSIQYVCNYRHLVLIKQKIVEIVLKNWNIIYCNFTCGL